MSVTGPLDKQPTPPIHGEATPPEKASGEAHKASNLVKGELPNIGKHTTPPDVRREGRNVAVTKEVRKEAVETATDEALKSIALMFSSIYKPHMENL